MLRATSDGQSVDFNVHVVMNEFVGVEEQTLVVEAYPNPCPGQLHLSAGNGQSFEYRIYNLLGQTVTFGLSQGLETVVDLSSCPKGIYFVAITQDGKCLVNKLTVQ